MDALQHTPLYHRHVALGGRIVDFGGWALPVQFSGILQEHQAVREAVGIFDVSHMGEIAISGSGAQAFVSHLVTNDLSGLEYGKVVYSPMCYTHGGTVDDLLIYKRREDYLLVVNAANKEKDYRWIADNAPGDVNVVDESSQTAQIALQGPKAFELLEGLVPGVGGLKSFTFDAFSLLGWDCLISRTGYTGEDGVEIYVDPVGAPEIWDALIDAGAVPCGLGARDTLRFESAMPLYGHEMDQTVSPLTAGLGFFVKLGKAGGFIGEAALAEEKAESKGSRRIGVQMLDRGIPREGYEVMDGAGQVIGVVTSGTFSPTLKQNLAMARIHPEAPLPAMGAPLQIAVRGKALAAQRIKLPFYKRQKT